LGAAPRRPQPFSLHAPLSGRGRTTAPSAAFFLAEGAPRERSFADLEATLAAARSLGADYVVTHLNGPADVTEEARAEALAFEAGARVAALARRHGCAVHIECGGYRGGFHRARQFVALARAFPELGLCLDVGHLWLVAQLRARSAYAEIEALAPYARSLHLWAARDLDTYRRWGHVPLHPSRNGRAGWLDVGRAVAPVLAARPECAVIFEYPWQIGTASEAMDGLRWALDVLESARARAS
jgi:hypothetical protein